MAGQLFDSIEAFLNDEDWSRFTAVVVDSALMNPSAYRRICHPSEDLSLPVIAISKTDAPNERKIAQESGASAFFREPLDGETLLDAITWEQSKLAADR